MIGALLALSPGRRIAAFVTGSALMFSAGAAATIAWEHRAPWGLEAKRAKLERRIEAPVTGYIASLKAMTTDRDAWLAAADRCEDKREDENKEAADAISRASTIQASASSGAFNQGYAAGRAVGLQKCGANHDPEADLGNPGGLPDAGGLRDGQTDLSALFGVGAYVPGPGLPAQR